MVSKYPGVTKYMGRDEYPLLEGETRVMLRIKPIIVSRRTLFATLLDVKTPLRWTSPLDVKPGEITVCQMQRETRQED